MIFGDPVLGDFTADSDEEAGVLGEDGVTRLIFTVRRVASGDMQSGEAENKCAAIGDAGPDKFSFVGIFQAFFSVEPTSFNFDGVVLGELRHDLERSETGESNLPLL